LIATLGSDYNDALVWTSNEGIQVKPFYHADDSAEFQTIATPSSFKICDTIFVSNAENANTAALSAIENGAESIKFIVPSKTIDFETLIANINLEVLTLYFEFQFIDENAVKKAVTLTTKAKTFITIDSAKVTIWHTSKGIHNTLQLPYIYNTI